MSKCSECCLPQDACDTCSEILLGENKTTDLSIRGSLSSLLGRKKEAYTIAPRDRRADRTGRRNAQVRPQVARRGGR